MSSLPFRGTCAQQWSECVWFMCTQNSTTFPFLLGTRLFTDPSSRENHPLSGWMTFFFFAFFSCACIFGFDKVLGWICTSCGSLPSPGNCPSSGWDRQPPTGYVEPFLESGPFWLHRADREELLSNRHTCTVLQVRADFLFCWYSSYFEDVNETCNRRVLL